MTGADTDNSIPAGTAAGPVARGGAQQELLETVRLLAEEIGPRPSAGEGERKAAAVVIDRLRRAGYTVELEPFDGLTSFTWVYAPLYALGALAGWLGRRWLSAGAVLGLAALAAYLAEVLGFPALARLAGLPRGRSQNVVARLPLPEGTTLPARQIVLVAHLDSQRAALPFHPRLVGRFRQAFLAYTTAFAVVALGGLVRVLAPRRMQGGGDGLLAGTAAVLLVPLAALVHREVAMPAVPGANDNASGVAVLLAAADRIAARLATLTDRTAAIWIVFTGCEESGLGGMHQFLARHGGELNSAETLFLNVDTVGAGMLTLINQEGPLWPLLADAELLEQATRVALQRRLHFQTQAYHTLPTDAQVPMARGYRALTLMAMDDHGRLPNWHWPTDTWDRVDPETMESALQLVVTLVRRLGAG
ncbi:MAG TPA: M28 family peptidase, partial [Chloroflexia bacterium]|nr:M28 family peptidase [Chloroflexia bacterium]